MTAHAATLSDHARELAGHATEISGLHASVSANQARITRSAQAVAAKPSAIEELRVGQTSLESDIGTLSLQLAHVRENTDRNTAGIAIANALAGATWLQSDERIAMSANWGHYEGHNAVAFSAATRLSQRFSASAALSAVPDRDEIGARAGVRWGW